MKFTAQADVAAPLPRIWDRLDDFTRFEALARARGAQVTRLDDGAMPRWQVAFEHKGRRREVAIALQQRQPPNRLAFTGDGHGLTGELTLELIAPAPGQTRLVATGILRPRTLAARVVISSLRLVKRRAARRFQSGIARLAADLARQAGGGSDA